SLAHGQLLYLVPRLLGLRADVSIAQPLIWCRSIPRHRSLLRHGTRSRQREHQRLSRVMSDVARHMMVLLVDMPVEYGHILVRHQRIDHALGVGSRPVPLRIEIEQRSMRQHDYGGIGFQRLQVCLEPLQLRVPDYRSRIGHVIEDYEMDSLM